MLTRRSLVATSLVAAASPAIAATPKDVLVIAKQIDDMTSLDPHESFEASGGEIVNNLYEKLVMPNLQDADRLEGELAERWGVSEDGLVLSFTLRPGAVFASGKPVTAVDAAFSLQRAIRMNKSPAFILGQFGFTPDNLEERITASGENTLSLRTTERQAPSFVLACLTADVASIVERDAFTIGDYQDARPGSSHRSGNG